MGGSTFGGIAGIVIGLICIYMGFQKKGRTDPNVTVTNDSGQSATLDSEGGKWVLIIVGLVLAIGGIVYLIANAN